MVDFDAEGRMLIDGKLADAASGADEVEIISVPVRRLDDLLAEPGSTPPDLVKIDVEGAETDVLRGAAQTLAKVRPILLIELHGTNEAVAHLLSEAGYLSRVLGSRSTMLESPWNAQIIALPAERADLVPLADMLAEEANLA